MDEGVIEGMGMGVMDKDDIPRRRGGGVGTTEGAWGSVGVIRGVALGAVDRGAGRNGAVGVYSIPFLTSSSILPENSKNGELGAGNNESDSMDESTSWGWETVNCDESRGCGEIERSSTVSNSVNCDESWNCGETEGSSTISCSSVQGGDDFSGWIETRGDELHDCGEISKASRQGGEELSRLKSMLLVKRFSPNLLRWRPSLLKRSLCLQKMLKLSMKINPLSLHAPESHVFSPRSRLNSKSPLPTVGRGPLINVSMSSLPSLLKSSIKSRFMSIEPILRESFEPRCSIS